MATAKPKIGEKVYAIGSPRGLENTFSSGEVSQWRDTNLMQISALIDHGSSGGALINEYGEVIGITSGSFADGSQANLNYAWSIDAVKPYIND
jgi:serine protease Do